MKKQITAANAICIIAVAVFFLRGIAAFAFPGFMPVPWEGAERVTVPTILQKSKSVLDCGPKDGILYLSLEPLPNNSHQRKTHTNIDPRLKSNIRPDWQTYLFAAGTTEEGLDLNNPDYKIDETVIYKSFPDNSTLKTGTLYTVLSERRKSGDPKAYYYLTKFWIEKSKLELPTLGKMDVFVGYSSRIGPTSDFYRYVYSPALKAMVSYSFTQSGLVLGNFFQKNCVLTQFTPLK